MAAQEGYHYTYTHPGGLGFGEHVKDQAGMGEQTAEMKEIDLKDGTPVFVIAMDESEGVSNGWPIIDWTDGTGIYRITTIDPVLFDELFVEIAGTKGGKK